MRLIKTLESNLEKLPQGFSRVEYLESTGTQYIDTGVILTNNHTVEFTYQATSTPQYSKGFYGCLQNNGGSNRPRHGMITRTSTVENPGKIEYGYGTNNNNLVGSALNLNKHTVKQEKNILYVDGSLVSTFSTTAFTQSVSAYFCHFRYSASYTPALARYYYSKWWNGDTLVRDFIPVTDANGIGCWYDRVNEEVYYSESEEDFVAGPKIYQVEYIESTGTQYIDTGIYLTNNHSVEIKYQFTELPAIQERRGIFGAYDNSQRYGTLVSPTTNLLEYGYGLGNPWYQPHPADLKRHTFKFDKNLLYEDGKLIYTFGTDSFTLTTTAHLGSFNYTNYSPAKARYYSSKWWDGDTLVRDFVPVKSANNEYFWYDKVEGKIYYNIGTGSFVGSNPYQKKVRFIKTPKLPKGYKRVEYLESTATSTANGPYINTGINYFADFELIAKQRESLSMKGCGVDQTHCVERENATTNAWRFRTGESTTYMFVTSALVTDLHKLKWKNNEIYIDDEKIGDFTKTSVSNSFLIFASNATGTNPINRYSLLVYGCKMWNPTTGALVRNYIPCLDTNDTPCLYDLVEQKPYYNAGNLSFTTGDVIPSQVSLLRLNKDEIPLPSEYKRLKYLQGTGTQYIITDIYPNQNTSVEIIGRFNSNVPSCLCACRWTQAPNYDTFGIYADSVNTQIYCGRYSDDQYVQIPTSSVKYSNGYIRYFQHKNILRIEGIESGYILNHEFDKQDFQSTRNITLFYFNSASSFATKGSIIKVCKIWDNDNLVRNYIPVLRTTDNTPGMYDLVNKVFYTNSGTGEFLYE